MAHTDPAVVDLDASTRALGEKKLKENNDSIVLRLSSKKPKKKSDEEISVDITDNEVHKVNTSTASKISLGFEEDEDEDEEDEEKKRKGRMAGINVSPLGGDIKMGGFFDKTDGSTARLNDSVLKPSLYQLVSSAVSLINSENGWTGANDDNKESYVIALRDKIEEFSANFSNVVEKEHCEHGAVSGVFGSFAKGSGQDKDVIFLAGLGKNDLKKRPVKVTVTLNDGTVIESIAPTLDGFATRITNDGVTERVKISELPEEYPLIEWSALTKLQQTVGLSFNGDGGVRLNDEGVINGRANDAVGYTKNLETTRSIASENGVDNSLENPNSEKKSVVIDLDSDKRLDENVERIDIGSSFTGIRSETSNKREHEKKHVEKLSKDKSKDKSENEGLAFF
jgi:hypothetical protein